MRKLMIFCFTILFAVLSALSCLNFAFSALDQVEEDKLMLTFSLTSTMRLPGSTPI